MSPALGPPATQPFGYSGRPFDPTTGHYDYRTRVYVPALGRFLQRDPAGAVDGHLYTYAGNHPLAFGDPSGLARTDRADGWSVGAEPGVGAGTTSGGGAGSYLKANWWKPFQRGAIGQTVGDIKTALAYRRGDVSDQALGRLLAMRVFELTTARVGISYPRVAVLLASTQAEDEGSALSHPLVFGSKIDRLRTRTASLQTSPDEDRAAAWHRDLSLA